MLNHMDTVCGDFSPVFGYSEFLAACLDTAAEQKIDYDNQFAESAAYGSARSLMARAAHTIRELLNVIENREAAR